MGAAIGTSLRLCYIWPVDKLLEQLRLWRGGLRVEAGHFTGWSLGALLSRALLLTRMGQARDWGTGLPLKAGLLGKMSRLEERLTPELV
jgi:hypothetical protein